MKFKNDFLKNHVFVKLKSSALSWAFLTYLVSLLHYSDIVEEPITLFFTKINQDFRNKSKCLCKECALMLILAPNLSKHCKFSTIFRYSSDLWFPKIFSFTSIKFLHSCDSIWDTWLAKFISCIRLRICGPSKIPTCPFSTLSPRKVRQIHLKQSLLLPKALINCFISPCYMDTRILSLSMVVE